MKRIYNKTVRELIKEYLSILPPAEGAAADDTDLQDSVLGRFARKDIQRWFVANYPKIKLGTLSAHLILLSTNAPSRIHYNVHPDGSDDLLYQESPQQFRPYRAGKDPRPIYKGEAGQDEPPEDESSQSKEFAYEHDLQSFLARNLELIEPGLCLYEEDGINGIEYPAGGRFIDLLAVDNRNDFVVIELKASKGYDRVVGQILRYMAWIKQNLADPIQKVRGIIIAKEISEDLRLATSLTGPIELYEYELMMKLAKVKTNS
jgi:hypothetical protein